MLGQLQFILWLIVLLKYPPPLPVSGLWPYHENIVISTMERRTSQKGNKKETRACLTCSKPYGHRLSTTALQVPHVRLHRVYMKVAKPALMGGGSPALRGGGVDLHEYIILFNTYVSFTVTVEEFWWKLAWWNHTSVVLRLCPKKRQQSNKSKHFQRNFGDFWFILTVVQDHQDRGLYPRLHLQTLLQSDARYIFLKIEHLVYTCN